MSLEAQYQTALELTREMLAAAKSLDWNVLARIENERATLVKNAATYRGTLSSQETERVAALIAEIARESAEIIERAECWQEHAKILLRINKPTS